MGIVQRGNKREEPLRGRAYECEREISTVLKKQKNKKNKTKKNSHDRQMTSEQNDLMKQSVNRTTGNM